jgi:hypothetical protein
MEYIGAACHDLLKNEAGAPEPGLDDGPRTAEAEQKRSCSYEVA